MAPSNMRAYRCARHPNGPLPTSRTFETHAHTNDGCRHVYGTVHRFYKHLGFQELLRLDDDLYLGLQFHPSAPCKLPCTTVPPCVPTTMACGVIEGFYGRPWTLRQRQRLFHDMNAWGMSAFMYGPKVRRVTRVLGQRGGGASSSWSDLAVPMPPIPGFATHARLCHPCPAMR